MVAIVVVIAGRVITIERAIQNLSRRLYTIIQKVQQRNIKVNYLNQEVQKATTLWKAIEKSLTLLSQHLEN